MMLIKFNVALLRLQTLFLNNCYQEPTDLVWSYAQLLITENLPNSR
jgi:hypothetical protein